MFGISICNQYARVASVFLLISSRCERSKHQVEDKTLILNHTPMNSLWSRARPARSASSLNFLGRSLHSAKFRRRKLITEERESSMETFLFRSRDHKLQPDDSITSTTRRRRRRRSFFHSRCVCYLSISHLWPRLALMYPKHSEDTRSM